MKERQRELRKLEGEIQTFLVGQSHDVHGSQQEADDILSALAALENVLRNGNTPVGRFNDLVVSPQSPRVRRLLSAEVRLQTSDVADERTVSQVVRDEVLMRVYDWPVWRALLDATGPEGYVEYVPPPKPRWGAGVARTRPPMRAKELYDQYRQTYLEVERLGLGLVKAALLDVLDRVVADLAPAAAALGSLPSTGQGELLSAALNANDANAQQILFENLQPAAPDVASQNTFWLQRFPFLMPTDTNGQLTDGPYFGWAPERADAARRTSKSAADGGTARVRAPAEHVSNVFRLRYELGTTIEAEILRDLTLGLQTFRQGYTELVDQIHEVVGEFRSMPAVQLLAQFHRVEPVAAAPPPDFRLAQLTLHDG